MAHPMKGKSAVTYAFTGSNATPFNKNLKEFDDFIGETEKEKKAWKRVALALIVLVIASPIGWLYFASMQKAIPYVIEVQPWGESKYMGAIGQAEGSGIQITDASWRYYIRKFIEYTRNISPDRQVTMNGLNEAYQMVTKAGAGILSSALTSEGAFAKIGQNHREAKLETLIKITSKSWQADWIEVVIDAGGQEQSSVRKRGIYTVVQGEPDEKQIKSNPLGIFVDSFQIQDVE